LLEGPFSEIGHHSYIKSFVDFTKEPKRDKVQVVIEWKEGKVIHKETTDLKKKFLF